MRRLCWIGLPLVAGAIYFGWKIEQPVKIPHAANWQASITGKTFTNRSFMVPVAGAEIEATMLLPNPVSDHLAAVVFFPGSGHSLYQNYAPGFLETHLQNVFLPRGVAVVYMNKRGMGASTGNWMNQDIPGFADDMLAVVQSVRAMPEIDAARVGVAGHSQGGWVAVRAAATDPDLAFALNLMGPLRPPLDQFYYSWHTRYACQGFGPFRTTLAYRWKRGITGVASMVSRALPLGQFEFDRKFFAYETAGLLPSIDVPLLSVFGSTDNLVDGAANEAFLATEFKSGIPAHLRAVTLTAVNHRGYLRADICDETAGTGPEDASPEVKTTIEAWLTGIGL